MSKHTPGPWRVAPRGGSVVSSAPCVVAHVPRYHVKSLDVIFGRTVDFTSDEHREANASLIAAAPDLLEACVALVEAREGLVSGMADRTERAAYLAKVAIAKAEGK